MPNKILILRAGFCSLSHYQFFPLLAVRLFLSMGLLPCKRCVKLSSVLDLPNAARKKAAAFLELLEIVQADNIRATVLMVLFKRIHRE